MDVLRPDQLVRLIEKQTDPCVSIYLPTHKSLPEAKQDPIRFKNLLRQAESKLADNLRAPDVTEFLKPAQHLLDDSLFWRYQDDGLAVFVSATDFHSYRVPVSFPELVVVGSHFHIKPLLPLIESEGHFFILALSRNEVRLIEGTRYGASEVKLQNVPGSLAEVLGNYDLEKQLQFHARAQPSGDKRAAAFHGQGGGIDDLKPRIVEYLRQVDGAVRPLLKDDSAPLVLAGVSSLFPIYQEVNTYGNLLEGGIEGNPESLTGEQLREQAMPMVEPRFDKSRRDAEERYHKLAGTGRTSNDLQEILTAANDGRVEILFVAVGTQVWGNFDDQNRSVMIYEEATTGARDLLDLCAVLTVRNRGSVHVTEPHDIPGSGPIAAVFRY